MIKNSFKLLITAVALTAAPQVSAEKVNCLVLSNTVKTTVAASKSSVLQLVSTYVSQNESCACEIVKAAIVASDANAQLVADIAETAIIASPDQVRLIGQCAVAVAPDAYDNVLAVVNKYTGDSSADTTYEASEHSSKGGSDKDAVAGDRAYNDNSYIGQDPRNYPGQGVAGDGAGPTLGGGPGGSLNPFVPQPPIVNPQPATNESN